MEGARLFYLSDVRFHGSDPEPREGGSMQSCQLILGLSSGHIPGSISMPFQKLIDPKTGQFHDMEHLRNLFKTQLDSSKDTITSCGTGKSLYFR
jgi:thiosulfate/3-mercaptopyruvate sulfurtransferase